jgi:hypothetical protein
VNLSESFLEILFKLVEVVFLFLVFFIQVFVLNNSFFFLDNILDNRYLDDLLGGLASNLANFSDFLFFLLNFWDNLMGRVLSYWCSFWLFDDFVLDNWLFNFLNFDSLSYWVNLSLLLFFNFGHWNNLMG